MIHRKLSVEGAESAGGELLARAFQRIDPLENHQGGWPHPFLHSISRNWLSWLLSLPVPLFSCSVALTHQTSGRWPQARALHSLIHSNRKQMASFTSSIGEGPKDRSIFNQYVWRKYKAIPRKGKGMVSNSRVPHGSKAPKNTHGNTAHSESLLSGKQAKEIQDPGRKKPGPVKVLRNI